MQTVNLFDNVIGVFEALNFAKVALEGVTLVVQGEVTGINTGKTYSAVYFSVKDSKSVMPCHMWNSSYDNLGFQLQEGMLVNLTGNFSVYTKKGRMDFNVVNVEKVGEGQLHIQVNKLIEKLDKAGVLDASNKKPIPDYPEKIGVITSGSGAVIHDILRTIRRRAKGIEVNFWGVNVEGKDAPSQIIEAIRAIDEESLDVILLVRGGGSFEDMMPFNDEALCYAIHESKTPIVTGIGHEKDTTVADLVSDLRASTPTAAAEIVTQNLMELPQKLEDGRRDLGNIVSTTIDLLKRVLQEKQLKLDATSPLSVLEQQKMRLDFNAMRIQSSVNEIVKNRRLATETYARQLESLSPLAVLARGFSYTTDENDRVIKSIDDVDVKDDVFVVLSDGKIRCETKSKEVFGGR